MSGFSVHGQSGGDTWGAKLDGPRGANHVGQSARTAGERFTTELGRASAPTLD